MTIDLAAIAATAKAALDRGYVFSGEGTELAHAVLKLIEQNKALDDIAASAVAVGIEITDEKQKAEAMVHKLRGKLSHYETLEPWP